MFRTGLATNAVVAAIVVVAVAVVVVTTGCEREEFDSEAVAESADGPVDRSDQFTTGVEGAEVEVGEESRVEFQVFPGPDLRINDEFPWAIEFDDVEGLELGASSMDWTDMELRDERATIPVDVTAAQVGRYTLEAKADLSVCNDERCDILRGEPVELVVEAQE